MTEAKQLLRAGTLKTLKTCLPQSSYISGIASGANVDKSWVTIVGVNSATSVNVNTQVRGRIPAVPW